MTARKGWLVQCDGCGQTEFISGGLSSGQLDRFLKANNVTRSKKLIYCTPECGTTHKQKQQKAEGATT